MYFRKGQITFDFLLSLATLSLLFMFILSIINAQTIQWRNQSEQLLMERTCELISMKIMDVYINGDGYSETFYTRIPITLYSGNELVVSGSYLCILPTNYLSHPVENAEGEFKIENKKGNISIERIW